MKYLLIIPLFFLLACDKSETVLKQPAQKPKEVTLPQITSWVDTLYTGVLRHSIFTYNKYGNPVRVQSEHNIDPDSFIYDSLQRLIEHRRLFIYQYLYNESDSLPYGAIEIWPYDQRYNMAFTYDTQNRIIKVVSDYIEGSNDEIAGERHIETNYVYDQNGNLITSELNSNDYNDKPSIYRTNKWWQLIHLNFSKNGLNTDSDYNKYDLPGNIHSGFLGLGAGTVVYKK